MNFKFLLLYCVATAMPVILGSIAFYTEKCPTIDASSVSTRIELGKKVRVSNPTSINSMQWSYPSSKLTIQFFEHSWSLKPYATVTGIKEGTSFMDQMCGWDGLNGLKVDLNRGVVKQAPGLFLTNDSYYRVVSSVE